jgi:hypothetical protein
LANLLLTERARFECAIFHRLDVHPGRNRVSILKLRSQKSRIVTAINYAKFYSRSHDAVIRIYDEAGNVIETHEHKGDFREW